MSIGKAIQPENIWIYKTFEQIKIGSNVENRKIIIIIPLITLLTTNLCAPTIVSGSIVGAKLIL